MKCIVEFSNGRSIIVEAQNQTEAVALARVELIKQGDKEWDIHAIISIKWHEN